MIAEIKLFVGLQFQQTKDEIHIVHSKYIKEILKTFGMEDSRPTGTLMINRCKLSKEDDFAKVNKILYKQMIGKI